MDNYNPYGFQDSQAVYSDTLMTRVMRKVYFKMFFALLVTAATAFYVAMDGSFIQLMAAHPMAYWGLFIVELAMVFSISGLIHKISSTVATLLFYGYSIINGLVLSMIFLVYDLGSIGQTFLITAGVFGAMTIYGYVTKRSLARFGSFLFMALIGLIICSVVNMFLRSSGMDWLISFAGVAIFIGLTAWDTQKIKEWAAQDAGANAGKIATIGALSLYLDFVNLFLYLLRFFGNSRN